MVKVGTIFLSTHSYLRSGMQSINCHYGEHESIRIGQACSCKSNVPSHISLILEEVCLDLAS